MIDVELLRIHLKRLTYRPGWELFIAQGEYEGPQLVIRAEVEDSYNPGQRVPLDIHTPLPPFATLRQFDRWLLWRLSRVAVHEEMEWLHGPDGKPLFDPHRPNADRDEAV